MRNALLTLALSGCLFSAAPARAEIDWSRVDAAVGKEAAIIGTVHKYGFPRQDLHVTLDGVEVKPGLALGGWIAFEQIGRESMMMGDLVVTEAEAQGVMRALLASGVQVSGVHNHLLRATPATLYMHVSAYGDPVELGRALRAALAETKTPVAAPRSAPQTVKLGFDAAQLDAVLGAKGKNNGGVYQFSIPRLDEIRVGGMAMPPAMGLATALNFEPTGEGKAAISGDFVVLGKEVTPLLKALQSNGVEVTALHNHMLNDEPRMFFVHFWAHDDAVRLAHALRAGLDVIGADHAFIQPAPAPADARIWR